MVIGALGVVTTKNIVHAALYLVIVLAGGAAQFLLLGQEFVAWVQVLVYIGAVIVLFLFGIMLTARADASRGVARQRPALAGRGGRAVPRGHPRHAARAHVPRRRAEHRRRRFAPSEVTNAIFRVYIIPFEVVGVLLLGALIGAVVLARRD